MLVFRTKKANIRITGSELDTGREINIADQSGLLESTFTVSDSRLRNLRFSESLESKIIEE